MPDIAGPNPCARATPDKYPHGGLTKNANSKHFPQANIRAHIALYNWCLLLSLSCDNLRTDGTAYCPRRITVIAKHYSSCRRSIVSYTFTSFSSVAFYLPAFNPVSLFAEDASRASPLSFLAVRKFFGGILVGEIR